jgi:uracil-DNA glycosylase family 4
MTSMNIKFRSFAKENRFADLIQAVQHCTLCPRLCGRTKVLSQCNGNLHSALLFVAEAPGRLGADRTGVPLCGDQSGDNFERLLGAVGWSRESVFTTNAVLCNPQDDSGNNGTPTPEEIANCSFYLEMTINVVNPAVIATLGATALKALEQICPHKLALKDAVAKPMSWAGRTLFPLYHPGPRALVHRGFAKQTSDFLRLAKLVDPAHGIIAGKVGARKAKPILSLESLKAFEHLVCLLVRSLGRISYFRLTKLLYLTDLTAIGALGRSVTGEVYLRQPDGPWPPALQKRLPALNGMEIILSTRGGVPMIEPGPCSRFEPSLDDDVLEVVVDIIEKYGNLNNKNIKAVAYNTAPMRYVLSQERLGRNMRNCVIMYKDRVAPDVDQSRGK